MSRLLVEKRLRPKSESLSDSLLPLEGIVFLGEFVGEVRGETNLSGEESGARAGRICVGGGGGTSVCDEGEDL